jgi:hypothetical protein
MEMLSLWLDLLGKGGAISFSDRINSAANRQVALQGRTTAKFSGVECVWSWPKASFPGVAPVDRYAGKKIKNQWKMEKDLPKDLQRIANKERRPGQPTATLTSDQIRSLTRFAPAVRSWFPHAFRTEGQLKTQFAYLLEEVNPNTHKFVLPPRTIHSNYPCLIGDHLVRVMGGSDPDQQAQQEPPINSDSVNTDTHPDRESESESKSSFEIREHTPAEETPSPPASGSSSDRTNEDKAELEMVQWQMTEDRLELRRTQDLNEAQRRQIAYQQEELRRYQDWITRSLELAEPFPRYLRRVLRLPPPRSVSIPAYLQDRLPSNPLHKED